MTYVSGFSPATLVVGANAMRSFIGGAKIHTGDPGVGGAASASSAAMVVPAFTTVDTDTGNWGLNASIDFTGGAPGGPATWLSYWTGTGGGATWCGNFPLTGDLTFDSSGNLSITEHDFTESSS